MQSAEGPDREADTANKPSALSRRHKARAIKLAGPGLKVAASAVHPSSGGAAITRRGCLDTLFLNCVDLGLMTVLMGPRGLERGLLERAELTTARQLLDCTMLLRHAARRPC